MPDIKIPVQPSSTPQEVVLTVDASYPSDLSLQAIATQIAGKAKITGTTPIVTPPVDKPPTGPLEGYKLVFSENFKTDAFIKANKARNNQTGNGGWDPFNGGSFKSVPAQVSGGMRSELQFLDSETPIEGALQWSAYYDVVVKNSGHSLQFHPQTSGGSASPGLWHVEGRFNLTNWYKGDNAHYDTGVTIEPKKFYSFLLFYKIGSAGYFRLLIDGKEVLNKTGVRVGDGSGQYLKYGWNSWGADGGKSVIYYGPLSIFQKV